MALYLRQPQIEREDTKSSELASEKVLNRFDEFNASKHKKGLVIPFKPTTKPSLIRYHVQNTLT